MALNDYKISGVPNTAQTAGNFTLDNMGNRGKPNIPGYSTEDMQDLLDELSTKVLAPAHNGLVDEVGTAISAVTATGLTDTQRVIVDDIEDAGGPSDIPTVGAIIDYVQDMGGGDMLSNVYATGTDPDQNEHTVDHALYADNAGELNGHDAAHFATAESLANVSENMNGIMTNEARPYFGAKYNQINGLTGCFPGYIYSNGTKMRVSIPVWKVVPQDSNRMGFVVSGTMSVYGSSGSVLLDGNINDFGDRSLSNSWHMITITFALSTPLASENRKAVTCWANLTFGITLKDSAVWGG